MELLPRRTLQAMIPTIPKPTFMTSISMPKSLKPLRPRPVSQLKTPKHSKNLRVALSVESILQQCGTKNAHTLHSMQRTAAVNRASSRALLPATALGVTALSVATALCYMRLCGPVHAEGGATSSAYMTAAMNSSSIIGMARQQQHTADELLMVKSVAQIGSL